MKPYTLTVELLRRESAEDAHGFFLSPQEYLLRQEDGYLSATLAWDGQFREDLAELSRPSPDRGAVQRLGDTLRAFLGELGWALHEARIVEALREGREVHLTFRLTAAELYTLPWELVTLKATGQHLCELPGCHLRYEWPGVVAPPRPTPPTEGGRILFAWSTAGDGVPAVAHQRALTEVCTRHGYPFDPDRDVVPNVSLRSLAQALEESPEPVAALHILCHGARSASGEYGLLWNDPREGRPVFVDAGDLRQVLAPHAGSLRMVVLCACQGGASAPDSHLGSVAQALHRVGIPAVVASRLPLTSEGSVHATEALYDALLGQLHSLPRALASVRARLREDAESLDWASLQLYARAEDDVAPRPFIFRPYRGLLSFQQAHRRFFFGREALQETLRQRMEQAVAGALPRFQLVAGASGSGKTSLVLAGLVPHLPQEAWDVAVMRPGESGTRGPRAVLDALLAETQRARAGRTLLLVVDQFEEVFTQVASAEERLAFVRALWALSRDAERGVVVLATMRIDYFERCGELQVDEGKRLDAIVYDDAHRLFVPQLQPEQLRSVIESPARRVGLELEPSLAERLQRDVGQEPGALPLLEYTLDLLWQRREGTRLTQRAYEELGGVTGALTRTADQLIDGLSPAERLQARRLLVELVDFGDESTPYTRRRVWEAQVRPEAEEARRAFDAVLDKLVASRLLVRGGDGVTPGGTWLQVAHEALLRRWERLAEWGRADRERVIQFRELQAWAEAWAAHRGDADGGDSYLLTGNRLGYARSLQERYPGALSPESARLIERSQALLQRQTRARRLRTWLTVGGALTAALVMGVLALAALGSAVRAQESARITTTELMRSEDPTTAVLLLREVSVLRDEPDWRRAALHLLQQPLSRALLVGHRGPVRAIAMSPDGTRVLTASDDGTARLWSSDGRGEPRVLQGHTGKLTAAAFSPDGTRVVTASEDGTARLWHTAGGHEPRVLQGHASMLFAAAFSPDGTRVVTASRDGTARVWRTDGRGEPVVLQGHTGDVLDARFDPAGTRVVTASRDKTARLWPVDGQGEPLVLSGHTNAVVLATFSPDGTKVVTASWDKTVRLWQAQVPGESVVLGEHDYVLYAVAFSPDGTKVVTASSDSTARVWRTDVRASPMVLEGHTAEVRTAVFSDDGMLLLTASSDGTARVWDAITGGLVHTLRGHERPILAAAFGAKTTQVLTASVDGTARVWETGGVGEPRQLPGTLPVFSPDGTRLATVASDGIARVWSFPEQTAPALLHGSTSAAIRLAFSPNGKWLLRVDFDGAARLWPSNGQGEPRVLEAGGSTVRDATFSPDGARVVGALADGTVRLWPVDAGGEPRVMRVLSEPLTDVAFSPNGTWLAAASKGVLALLELAGDGTPRRLGTPGAAVMQLAFSPEGRWLAVALADGNVELWPLEGLSGPRVLRGHSGPVFDVGFNGDGTRLVTASMDGTARLWPVAEEGESLVLTGHILMVTHARFSPDDRWVMTTSGDGTSRLWPADGMGAPIVFKGLGSTVSLAFSPTTSHVATANTLTTHLWSLGAETLDASLREATSACLTPMQRQRFLDEDDASAREGHAACEQGHGRGALTTPWATPVGPEGVASSSQQLEHYPMPVVPPRLSKAGSWGLGGALGMLVTTRVTEQPEMAGKMTAMVTDMARMLEIQFDALPDGAASIPVKREAALAWLQEVTPAVTRQLTEKYGQEQATLFETALRLNTLAASYQPGPEGASRARAVSEELRSLRSRAKLSGLAWGGLHKKLEEGTPLKPVAEEALRVHGLVSMSLMAGF
jgi:WD40 repeat protein